MANVFADAIEGSNDENIKAMPPSIRHHLVESGSLCFAPRNYIGILAHDFVSALLRHFAQVEQLRFDVLVSSAHACVDSGAFLHFNSFFLEIRYASIARRTNSATGAPVFADSFWSFSSCCSFKNRAVLLIGVYSST